MPDQPRIFVSSTIRDFKDLRLAMKFWLEEAGYLVFLSECNDFPVDPASSTFTNCLAVLRSCHYMLLLIGYRRGSFYDEANGVSVTRAEYQAAYEMVRAGKLKLVSCVRAEVEEDLRSGNFSDFEDHRFTEEFLAEVRRDEEVRSGSKTGGPFPKGNWIFRFREFRDLAQALSSSLRVGSRLRRRAMEANVLRELELNLKELLSKTSDGTIIGFPPRWERLQQEIPLSPDDLIRPVAVSPKQVGRLAFFAVALRGCSIHSIATSALDEAINSGEFLEYDSQADQFTVGKLHASLLDLRREIVALRSMLTQLDLQKVVLEVMEQSRRTVASMSGMHITVLFASANRIHNVRYRTTSLAAYLSGETAELLPPELAPETPFGEKEIQALKAERLTDQDVVQWLRRFASQEEPCVKK
jgi:hypothetical protein